MTNFLAGQLGFVLGSVPWLGMNDAHLLAHVCIPLSMAMSVRLDSGVRLDSAGSALPPGRYVLHCILSSSPVISKGSGGY